MAAHSLDRLRRRPAELEDFVALYESVEIRDVAETADIDLGDDNGLFMARSFAAFAAKECGAQVRRKLLQNAEAGCRTIQCDGSATTTTRSHCDQLEATVVR